MSDLNALADLQQEVRYLLNHWDPIGVYDESLNFPTDEYDCVIGPLLVRLARRDSRPVLSQYLWDEVENHFGLDPVQCETDHFADRLLAWYASKNPAWHLPGPVFGVSLVAESLSAAIRGAARGNPAAREHLRTVKEPRGGQGASAVAGIGPASAWNRICAAASFGG